MADAENHRPGEPPEIRDEAADTPMWLPALGLTLLLLAAIGVIYQSQTEPAAEEAETAEAAEGDAEDGEEAPAAEEAAAEAPAGH